MHGVEDEVLLPAAGVTITPAASASVGYCLYLIEDAVLPPAAEVTVAPAASAWVGYGLYLIEDDVLLPAAGVAVGTTMHGSAHCVTFVRVLW